MNKQTIDNLEKVQMEVGLVLDRELDKQITEVADSVEDGQVKEMLEMYKDTLKEAKKFETVAQNILEEYKKLLDVSNALYKLENKNSDIAELLVNFIENHGLEDELLDYIDDVSKNEKMPPYKEAAEHFKLVHQFDEHIINNNYKSNLEILDEQLKEKGTSFLLEKDTPLFKEQYPLDMGQLSIGIHDEMMKQQSQESNETTNKFDTVRSVIDDDIEFINEVIESETDEEYKDYLNSLIRKLEKLQGKQMFKII